MNKLFTLFMVLCCTVAAQAQGWKANYGGVMLQGFYWDSFQDTNWKALEEQADELSQNFSLVWVPNSARAQNTTMDMGYHPVYWFTHNSAFGTEAQLRSMIATFKQKGLGVIADVVINHRLGVSDWTDFPAETVNGITYQLTSNDICSDDEAAANGKLVGTTPDTGEGWGGARDLDHTSANVQQNVLAYLRYLTDNLGYAGYRYDFVKGYAPSFVGKYNAEVGAQFSVGEYWDGNPQKVEDWINGTKQNGTIESAAFDFPLKYYINDAFGSYRWERLTDAALATDPQYSRYAVTFVDNHDTGRSAADGGAPLTRNIEAANAYILTLPGTPCVFWTHWTNHKTAIKKLIWLRKALGINNQSSVSEARVLSGGFMLHVGGAKGSALLCLGNTNNVSTAGYKLAMQGDNYQYYVPQSLDIEPLSKIKEEKSSFAVPSFCVLNAGETAAFFEAPAAWNNTIYCWRWDNQYNYTSGTWPGEACTQVGTRDNGNAVYKWTWSGNRQASPASNAGIIFSCTGKGQTSDFSFENGAYYTLQGKQGSAVATGISHGVFADEQSTRNVDVFTIDGKCIHQNVPQSDALRHLQHGIYIVNQQKVQVK